ncbi:hypothetical protein I4540_17910 [Klebsiella michiganensis]|uniref:hypothetical protein n=1 Tax=Klebsiella TaxID=570 RepID=UPI0013D64197|nr:hypothetical protein [Klebsiella michiganensis]EIY5008390.1 hypothetical protein [Klebsiella variicola]MBG2583633.1 hypothetical protein [Klebsiella michiganensis]MBG2593639.1 hypothetical protein [Klebsiella michiganensis]MDQ7855530.1 hypothetical protein [Klebsiella michiganensis]HAT3609917.1 hypothetical protein [Klebsiella michiganensis]
MWAKKRLAPSAAADGLMCSVLVVHPWTSAGQRTGTGHYLSPGNAIESAASRLAGAAAGADVTAWLITAPTLTEFISQLASLAAIFPLPEVSALYRRAATAASLATSRMQIPSTPGGLPAARALSVSTLRRAALSAQTASAGQAATPDLSSALAAFKQQRAALIAAAEQESVGIGAQSLAVYSVSVAGDVTGAIREIREDIPDTDHVFTLCLAFIGDDLTAIRGMLHDEFAT